MSLATAASAAMRPQNWPISVWVLILTGLAYVVGTLVYQPPFPCHAPRLLKGYSILGSPRFFSERGRFLSEGRQFAQSGNWSFYFGKMRIVGVSGHDGRQVFFENRDLDFTKGYAALFNATPQIDVSSDGCSEDDFGTKFKQNIVKLLRKDILSDRLHLLVADTRHTMDALASRIDPASKLGISDPFEDMYGLVFQLTMRTVGCDEIAEDAKLLQRVLGIFESIDAASTATKVMFPWMPTVGHFRRVYGGARMYMLLEKVVKERNDRGVGGNDALQFLIDNGNSTVEMVAFMIGALFAGLVNSGINAAYLLCFLATDTHWYQKVQEEVDKVIACRRRSEDQTAEEILAKMDMDEWEAEFPLINIALKETIRYTITGCGFRYNGNRKDIPIGKSGEVLPHDSYVVYHFDTSHMNPDFFPEPLRWDPGRYLSGREEDKKDPYAFIGWGAGRHPCLGMRFAKLEMAVTTALFVARFDFHLVNANGKKMDRVPENSVDRNTHSASKPREKIFLNFKPRT
ncbi:hypothetical protein EsH8_X_000067 [Colletotrichum jinshuiense]